MCVVVACISALARAAELPLRVATVIEPPFVEFNATGSGQFSGILIDLFDWALQKINNDSIAAGGSDVYTANYYAVKSYGSLNPATGQWTGVIGELVAGRADASSALLTVTSERVSAVSFAVPFLSSGKSILTKNVPIPRDNWFFARPFAGSTWAIVGGTIATAVFAMWLIDAKSPYGARRLGPDAEARADQSLVRVAYNMLMTVLERDMEPPRAWSTRIVAVGAFFFIIFILVAYEASLTSLSIASSSASGISTFADVQQTGALYSTVANSSTSSWVMRNPSYAIRATMKQMVTSTTLQDAVSLLRTNQVAAVLASDVLLRYYLTQPPCDLQMPTDVLALDFNAFATSKSPVYPLLATQLSTAVSTALEEDVLDTFFSTHLTFEGSCGGSSYGTQNLADAAPADSIVSSVQVTVSQVAGVFYVFAAMMGLSWCILGFERAVYSPEPQHWLQERVIECCNGYLVEDDSDSGSGSDTSDDSASSSCGGMQPTDVTTAGPHATAVPSSSSTASAPASATSLLQALSLRTATPPSVQTAQQQQQQSNLHAARDVSRRTRIALVQGTASASASKAPVRETALVSLNPLRSSPPASSTIALASGP